MKKINKLIEPVALTQYRSQPTAIYDGPDFTTVKDDIRQKLLEEQGHLCAYCMARIKIGNMKVEHFAPQSLFPIQQLQYSNMLGCCKGNEGSPKPSHTCDTKKGNLILKYSPSISTHHIDSRVTYSGSGRILSRSEDFDSQLNTVLNLNQSRLKENRVAALEAVVADLGRKQGTRTKTEIQQYIAKYSSRDRNNKFHNYYGYILFDLQKRLKRAPQ
ncbi:TIGR02646 family protein [Vibrio splendidus]|uniref:TIGR02646 family protein n=1 Tax=Vibrio splendidus TaxID=29497 RepID=A0A2T5EID3_VIBSP|nr:retron system putative HNH endonuclease [Vibrio splendidus]PTP19729.1 TIGR02646 family protein [Vibrio splendidus]